MEEFPSNSKARGRPARDEPKKVEKVISSEVVRRKKPLPRRMKDFLIGDRGVLDYIAQEIVLPGFRDLFVDAVNLGMERRMYGEGRSTSRRTGRRPGSDYVAYNRYSRGGRDDPRDREREDRVGRRGDRAMSIEDIVIPVRVEAEEVLDQMFEMLSKYSVVSVADLYGLCGVEGTYTDERYGWENLRGSRIQRVPNGYLLDLPRPEPLG